MNCNFNNNILFDNSLIIYPPDVNITYNLWNLLVLLEDNYYNERIGILFGLFEKDDFQRLIGFASDLRIIGQLDILDYCQNNISAKNIECCNIYDSINDCLPPVADVAIFLLNRDSLTKILNNLLLSFSFVNGRALILSTDLTFLEIIQNIPDSISSLIKFLKVTKTEYLEKYYKTIILIDLSLLWIQSTNSSTSTIFKMKPLHQIPFSTIQPSFSYGYDHISFQNVCLFNQNSILLFPNQSNFPSITNLNSLIPKEMMNSFYRNWKIYDYDPLIFSNISNVPFLPRTTLATAPPDNYSTIHLVQTILPLIHYIRHPSNYKWIQEIIESNFPTLFLFPTMKNDEFQWNLHFISLIKDFLQHHINLLHPSSNFTMNSHELQRIKVLLQDDIIDLISNQRQSYRYNINSNPNNNHNNNNNNNGNLLCFEKLILILPVHISTPYLSHSIEADAIRRYSYDWIDHKIQINQSYFDPIVSNRKEVNSIDCDISINYLNTSKDHVNTTQIIKNCYDSDESNLTPNHSLRVTLISRSHNRRIVNINNLIEFILTSNVIDEKWFLTSGGGSSKGVFLETYSFKKQIQLLKLTDILIYTHGAVMCNILFLKKYSGVIEILTSPWYHSMIYGTSLIMNLYYNLLPQTNINSIVNCNLPGIETCFNDMILLRGGYNCLELRQCDVIVDIDSFIILFHQTSHNVRFIKRNIEYSRIHNINNLQPYHLGHKRKLDDIPIIIQDNVGN